MPLRVRRVVRRVEAAVGGDVVNRPSPSDPNSNRLWSLALLPAAPRHATKLTYAMWVLNLVHVDNLKTQYPDECSVLKSKPLSMLAVPGGGGGLGAERDRQVRLHSVTTDLALDLPPSIPLPDGEEIPYGSSSRLHIRDTDQESEIYQKCIRAPPNRTVFEGESLPPYRASPIPPDWHHLHQHRCEIEKPRYPSVQVPPPPPVLVQPPTHRPRLSALTMVPCLTDTRTHHGSSSPSVPRPPPL